MAQDFENLEAFLLHAAEQAHPADNGFSVDGREYVEHVNSDALSDAWIDAGTSYIWKIGILAQWDSNKCDHAFLFIGHEREPGRFQFIGKLAWDGGENDDIGRSLQQYAALQAQLSHVVFYSDPLPKIAPRYPKDGEAVYSLEDGRGIYKCPTMDGFVRTVNGKLEEITHYGGFEWNDDAQQWEYGDLDRK